MSDTYRVWIPYLGENQEGAWVWTDFANYDQTRELEEWLAKVRAAFIDWAIRRGVDTDDCSFEDWLRLWRLGARLSTARRQRDEALAKVERISHHTICAYCGHEEKREPDDKHSAMLDHMAECEKHPLFVMSGMIAHHRATLRRMHGYLMTMAERGYNGGDSALRSIEATDPWLLEKTDGG